MSLPPTANPTGRRVNGQRLQEGRDAMNERLRGFAADRLAVGESTRKLAEFDEKIAAVSLDQGGRGGGHSPGAHAPEQTDPSSAIRTAFRRGRGYED
jgi:hypothetical protein